MRRAESPAASRAARRATGAARRQSSPFTGKRSARPAGKPGVSFVKERLRRCLPRHRCWAAATNDSGRPGCVFKACRNLSGPMWIPNQTLGRDRPASRWSAPSPGKGTRREEHAPSHRPQMSSGRLILDRVGRHQSPSPLHRRPQHNTHSPDGLAKGDISTLLGRVTFLLCVDTANYVPVVDQARRETATDVTGSPGNRDAFWS
jgi:hypothetical protein